MAVRVITGDERESSAQAQLLAEREALTERLSMALKLIFGVFSMLLALGALFVVLGSNVSSDNPLVAAVWKFCELVDGPFSNDQGIFRFHGAKGAKLDAIVNWGCAAIIYLLVGNFFRILLTAGLARHSGGKRA